MISCLRRLFGIVSSADRLRGHTLEDVIDLTDPGLPEQWRLARVHEAKR
jgi:hypothetical protein